MKPAHKPYYRDSFVMAYCLNEESIVCRTKDRYYIINVRTDAAREMTPRRAIKAFGAIKAKLPPLGKICVRRYVMRGHAVIAFDLGQKPLRWYYSVDMVLVDNDAGRTRAYCPCVHCGQSCEPGAPDPCLGWMADTGGACCGHGQARDAYVGFPGPRNGDSEVLRGEEALRYFATRGIGPASALACLVGEREANSGEG